MQRSPRRLGVALPCGGERSLAIEKLPGADHRLARLDPVHTGRDQRLGIQPAVGDPAGSLPNGKGAEIIHAGLLCAALGT